MLKKTFAVFLTILTVFISVSSVGFAQAEYAAEFVNGQRGEAVQQNVCGPIREGQVIAGGHCKFDVLIPLGSQPQNEFGDVNACHAGRFPGSRQGLVNAGGVISLAASGV